MKSQSIKAARLETPPRSDECGRAKPADGKEESSWAPVIIDAVGIGVLGVVANWLLSLGYKLAGTWISFGAVIAGLLLPTLFFHKNHPQRRKTIWIIFALVAATGSIPFWILAPAWLDRWQPPELPKLTRNVVLHFGGSVFSNTIEEVHRFNPKFIKIGDDEVPPFQPVIRRNRLYIKTGLFTGSGSPFLIDEAADNPTPIGWDRNYNSNAFEIVDGNGVAVFQLFYQKPNEIRINGVFLTKNRVLVAYDKGFAVLSFDAFKSDEKKLRALLPKSIFKYPSWKRLHELAD